MKLPRTSAAAILPLAILLLSGVTFPLSSVGASTGSSNGAHAPTFVGLANGGPSTGILMAGGPIRVTPTFSAPNAVTTSSSAATNAFKSVPVRDATPGAAKGAASDSALSTKVPPTVSCQPPKPGCDTIDSKSGGATSNAFGLNAVDSGGLYGFDIEPPDQGLCAGNGFVMEVLNIGELRVFNSGLSAVSGDVSLDSLLGLTSLGYSSGGDVSCLYDYNNGGHWFVTEFVSTNSESSGGTFTGCFAGVQNGCLEGIAVSVTNDPTGDYNVYFLNPNAVNSDPGAGYLLNDFAKIGNTRDAFLLFYDEFNQNGATIPACPAYGCFGFNGAQEFAFNKAAMELGFPVSSAYFNVAYENMGTDPNLYPIPADPPFQASDASCFSGSFAGQVCWYQVIPGQTPDPSQYDNNNGGSGFMAASMDFFGLGDNRVAAFDWTGLSNLLSIGCGTCSGISFGGQVLTGLQTYRDEGAACLASGSGFCGLAPQKAGPIPLGDNCGAFGLSSSTSCPESGIATNGDGATQASYAQHQLWFAVSTLVQQTFAHASAEIHVGAAYWIIGTNSFDSRGTFTLTDQAYVSPSHEDIEFPSIAGADSSGAVMAFTLSGDGGPTGADRGGFYPSTAFALVSTGPGGVPHTIHIAALGKSPQDGFSEYRGYPPTSSTRPRWGDYTQAIFVPSMHDSMHDSSKGAVYFSTEYIQSPNCSDSQFLVDPSCGGTRDPFANWGSSINFVTP